MATETVLVSEVIPAAPERIYAAWLDSRMHSRFTGDTATVQPFVGGRHTAFGGYIEGRTVEMIDGRRIVQTWRSTEFPAGAADSRLEVQLEPTLGGTLVTLLHTEIPEGQSDRYRQGWLEYYLGPMKKYFGRPVRPTAARAMAAAAKPRRAKAQAKVRAKPRKRAAKAAKKPARRKPARRKPARRKPAGRRR